MKKTEELIIDSIFNLLPNIKKNHSPNSVIYGTLQKQLQICIAELWGVDKGENYHLSNIGKINLPYFNMGNINSTHLFALDELIIFNYYQMSSKRYKNVYDLGANIGLHSIVLGKLGFNVFSYEPDPVHFEQLSKNISINNLTDNVKCFEKAVSTNSGFTEFTRVVGNTTGSHLSGSKDNLYGELEKFKVELIDIKSIFNAADLIKMDIEGHENKVITSLNKDDWANTDVILEVGSEKNAIELFEYFIDFKEVHLYSQLNNWKQVMTINDMPKSHRDGSLFISCKNHIF